MARTTVKMLEERLAALTKRVEALEHQKRRIGFEYEGSVGGELVQSTYYEAGGPGEGESTKRRG